MHTTSLRSNVARQSLKKCILGALAGAVTVFGAFQMVAQDTNPPTVLSAIMDCENPFVVTVNFNEAVNPDYAVDPFHYALHSSSNLASEFLFPDSIVASPYDPMQYTVTFGLMGGNFVPDSHSFLAMGYIPDLAGNADDEHHLYPVQFCVVPEPGWIALMLAGGATLFWRVRNRPR